jgi:hypothetical protein
MRARSSMEISSIRRSGAVRPLLRVVETPAQQSPAEHPTRASAEVRRPSLFALRVPPELGLLPALVFATVSSLGLGYLAHLALERWTLVLCM